MMTASAVVPERGPSRFKALAHRLPLVGPLGRLLATIARLPERLGRLEAGLDQLRQEQLGLTQQVVDLQRHHAAALARVTAQVDGLQHENHQRLTAQRQLEHVVTQVHEAQGEAACGLQRLQQQLRERPNGAAAQAAPAAPEGGEHSPLLDDFYWKFEQRFRGSTAEITTRLESYAPYLEELQARLPGGTVLDVGCGRGEWLQLARSRGLKVRGVDLNERMVRECQKTGLDVAYGDGVRHLQEQASRSLAAVTGFHIVEHLPFASLMQLLYEAYRVLAPGGFALFETPNPENILVGACTFYTDPTHKNPIPPPALGFMMETAGFRRQSCVRLRAAPLAPAAAGADLETRAVVERFHAGTDYAIIGFKDALEQ